MKKPIRKNAHKERIFTQRQNIQDFDYTKSHRGEVDGRNPTLAKEKVCESCKHISKDGGGL